MRKIAIVGSRHRGWQDSVPIQLQRGSADDAEMIKQMLEVFRTRYPQGFYVLTVGCDAGFGRMIKETALEAEVGLMEAIVQFNRHLPRPQYELLHLSRYAALIDVADEFHIFTTRQRISNIEDLIGRLRLLKQIPFFVYNATNALIESYDGKVYQAHEAL